MLSNKYYKIKLFVALLLILGLCSYSHVIGRISEEDGEKLLESCLNQSITCQGESLVFTADVSLVEKDFFIVYPWYRRDIKKSFKFQESHLEGSLPHKVVGVLSDIQAGDSVQLLVRFEYQKETRMLRVFHRDRRVRLFKYATSFMGLILAIMVFFRRYGFHPSRYALFRRRY